MMRNGMEYRSIGLKKWDDKDQSYEGEFLGDSFHGQGTYRWNKTDVYEGGFFSNQKEGYAVLSFSNNSSFEGLFIKNRPFGPGILTHSNGRQDAGFWVGQKLVRLSRPVDFIVPRLAPTSAAKIKLLQFRRLITLNEETNCSASFILKKCGCSPAHRCLPYSNLIYDPRSIFFNNLAFEKTFFTKANHLFENLFEGRYLNKSEDFTETETLENVNNEVSESQPNPNCLCTETFVMKYKEKEETYDICSESKASTNNELGLLAYYSKYGTLGEGEGGVNAETDLDEKEKDEEEENEETSSPTQIVSWNRSELCTEILKQIFRHRTFEEKLNFKIAKLMLGVRTEFRRTGEKEKECLQFLKMCSLGPAHVVKDLLCQYKLSEELMDSRGNTSLMFAAAADQHEIIDLLLDYGVDVNTFNDEGLTPLNLCLLRRLAQCNMICNWETAFLPTEIQRDTENNIKTEVWKDEESIESLDRIFGDGMSAYSKTGISQILEPEGDTNEPGEEQVTHTIHCDYQTIMMKSKFVPKSIRRGEFEQSVKSSARDRYLFDLSPQPPAQPPALVEVDKKKGTSRPKNAKVPKEVDTIGEEKVVEEGESQREEIDPALVEKLEQIDKTIDKLLSRGADPNISEVPKPSIHLGVFTEDINVVSTLLRYGANPDCQMYPNEGLLTPLHVIALLKPTRQNVEICRILLDHGANLEEETSPDFCICEAEKGFLDNLRGRTPLQVLCMRPDLEYADPKGYVAQIGLMLAEYSNKRHFYKGHSALTLAMLTRNIKLLTALLISNYFDPNETLGNDLGTALHVLVSTEYQKATVYEDSVKVCDLLLAANADPLKEFKTPPKLAGTCVDYAYREIDEEKAARKVSESDVKKEKKSGKEERGKERDHLKDHIKIVEYLEKKASELRKGSQSYSEESKDQGGNGDFTKFGNGGREKDQDRNGQKRGKKESDAAVLGEKGNAQKLKRRENEYKSIDETGESAKPRNEKETDNAKPKGSLRNSKDENEHKDLNQRTNPPEWNQKVDLPKGNQKVDPPNGNQKAKPPKGNQKAEPPKGNQKERQGREKEQKSIDETKSINQEKTESSGNLIKSQKEKKPREKQQIQDGGRNQLDDGHRKGKKVKMADDKDGRQGTKSKLDSQTNKCYKISKSDIFVKRDSSLEARKRMLRVFKSFSSSERFPENLRQSMLQVLANCATLDVDKLFLPYVVLRNGDLYYMFEARSPQKREQYSLI